ncbi:MAG TPA: hypothetical protein VNI01_16385 [Elusimicrobiota bacterium]|jgi:hypothetical protein|nr:hypothetical protein [Elusimicrobiota bacterium]
MERIKMPKIRSKRRSRAIFQALKKESRHAADKPALARQTRRAAKRRGHAARSAAARHAARTKGPGERRREALQAAQTRRSASVPGGGA